MAQCSLQCGPRKALFPPCKGENENESDGDEGDGEYEWEWALGIRCEYSAQVRMKMRVSMRVVVHANNCVRVKCFKVFKCPSLGLMDISILTWTNKYNSPWVALLLHAAIVFALSFLDFEDLLQVSTALYCISLVLNYIALVYLRIQRPDMPRPYQIGLGTRSFHETLAPNFNLTLPWP